MPTVRDLTRWPVVEGYCSNLSVIAGEAVLLHASTRGGSFDVQVTRVGGRRHAIWRAENVDAADWPVPGRAWAEGCGWPVALEIPTGCDWQPGFYEVELCDNVDTSDRGRSQAFFVVKQQPSKRSASLLLLSTSTYSAYNNWGGGCLYTGETEVSMERPLERGYLRRPAAPFEVDFDGRACNVSVPSDPTHRELMDYQEQNNYPLWTNSAGWHNWERRFVRWAEQDGWKFDFATSDDAHTDPSLFEGRRLLMTVGHCEYWSADMRDAVEKFVRSGGNWIVLSGDTATWQARFEGPKMICHKSFDDDPASSTPLSRLATTMWSDPKLGRPETQLHGLSFTRGGYHRVGLAVPEGDGGYEIHRPNHWVFEGLDANRGDLLGSQDFAVGYEVNGCSLQFVNGLPEATHVDGSPDSIEILATAPARLISISATTCEAPAGMWASLDPPGDLEEVKELLHGDPEATDSTLDATFCVMATMRFGDGEVFNAGSADWAYGLDRDETVQRVTTNLLTQFGCDRRPTV